MTKVIWMETSRKGITGGKSQHGIMRSLEAFHQRLTEMSLQTALPYEMFAHGTPYEVSKTYRLMKSEFEHKRSVAMVDAQRQALRGF
jgi:hypothetical protein